MPDFKTHLNALLESFGLDYAHAQSITLNYTANTTTSTIFTPMCDGFLILYCGCNVFGAFISDTSWESRNIANTHNPGGTGWCSVNAIVKKGRQYGLNVGWGAEAVGNSLALFVPFTYSRQKS